MPSGFISACGKNGPRNSWGTSPARRPSGRGGVRRTRDVPQDYSFDVVSKLDLQEVENAVNQANKEIATRFDFKGSVSRIEFDKKEGQLTLFSDDENKLKSVNDIIQSKLVKRGISLKSLDYKSIE